MRRDVVFLSQGIECKGWLYVPDNLNGRAPAIVMANAISAVKEITLPGYAERFEKAGFVVLAFDYRGFGGSSGEPRNHIVPTEQQQDIRNAISWLRTLPEVDPDNIGGWGVSLGAAHMLHLGAYDRRLRAVVCVATGLNTTEAMMGKAGLQRFLRILNDDHDQRYASGKEATYIPAVSLPGQGGAMAFPEAYEFYTEAQKTYAPTYDNRLTLESVENLFSDTSGHAMNLISPTALLMVHGEKDLIPVDAVRAAFDQAEEPKKLVVLDCTHTDLYVREPWLTQSCDAAIEWFNRYLHNDQGKEPPAHDIEKNKKTIRHFYEETAKGNVAIYDEVFSPDFISYSSSAAGEIRGPEAFKQANVMYLSSFPDFKVTLKKVIAEKNLVMVYGVASGTHQGPLMGIAPTGKRITWTGMDIYRFNDEGKIDGRWLEFDSMGMFQQLGVIPPAGGGEA